MFKTICKDNALIAYIIYLFCFIINSTTQNKIDKRKMKTDQRDRKLTLRYTKIDLRDRKIDLRDSYLNKDVN